MTFRPLADRILVAPIANRTESTAGLALVEDWKPEQMGRVVAVGPRKHPRRADVESLAADIEAHGYSTAAGNLLRSLVQPEPLCATGDLVLFSWMAGQELQDHDTDTRYLIVKQSDLLAVIDQKATPV